MYVDKKSIDRAAKALFKHVFQQVEKADPNYLWEKVDHKVREGFRDEVKAVIAGLSSED